MSHNTGDEVRPILTHQPEHGETSMNDEEHYAYIETDLDIRMSSGADELSSKTWVVEAEVRQWDGEAGSYFVQVWNEDMIRAGVTPEECVEDKRYPYHIQLGAIGGDRAGVVQQDLHTLNYQVSVDVQKWSGGNWQTRYLLVGGTLRGILHARFAGWGPPPPLGQFHISF